MNSPIEDQLFSALSTPLIIVPDMTEIDENSEFKRYYRRQRLLNDLFAARSVESVENICDQISCEGLNPDDWLINSLDNLERCGYA